MEALPDSVRVVEVGPRDGLQNEPVFVETADKVRFIEMLAEAGLSMIEVAAFVHPKRVPQMADAAKVCAQLPVRPDVRYVALVPNRKGLERAIEAGVRNIAVFTAASETFTQRNIGMTIAESLAEFREVAALAREHALWVRGYVSTAFVCPYEGAIIPAQVVPVVEALIDMGVEEVSLGDTIGHAVPDDVSRLTDALLPVLPLPRFAFHFHDTRQTALANVERALTYGVAVYDSSAGGTGGCPFAPGAAGNLATESLLDLLHRRGIETGVDRAKVAAASRFLESKLGRPLIT
jgi:isopropylmalate/homocitrate/citramalate synthase